MLLAGLSAVLSMDLLYLYFVGSWYDPIRGIELTEVVILALMSVVYLGLFIFKILARVRETGSGGGSRTTARSSQKSNF
jgi:hypothetical protein